MDNVYVIRVGSRLSLRLALVLEPDSNGFYFPAIPDNGSGLSLNVDKTQNETHTCRLPLRLLRVRRVTDVNFGG